MGIRFEPERGGKVGCVWGCLEIRPGALGAHTRLFRTVYVHHTPRPPAKSLYDPARTCTTISSPFLFAPPSYLPSPPSPSSARLIPPPLLSHFQGRPPPLVRSDALSNAIRLAYPVLSFLLFEGMFRPTPDKRFLVTPRPQNG